MAGYPVWQSIGCFELISYKASPCWPDRLLWWAISTAVISPIPFVHVLWGVRTGRLSNREVSVRKERLIPYVVEIGAVGLSYALMRPLRAPRQMLSLVLSVAIAIVAITGMTTFWKVSMHFIGTSRTATVLVIVFGKKAWPIALLVPLVG